ncbi:hypothetical protein SAY87_030697 [Trapa incisa]|uniref:RING-type domain-containing protein n=1 Tax=Trapa incisa TaxID=236973 RepID=A0AAN7QNK2_9MYRT|nr:hypothetical protein SAY87_030697 [Trapa incisa]
MSGGGWDHYYIPRIDEWPEAPWRFGSYSPTPARTGHSLSRGVALAPRSLSFNTIPSDSGGGGLPGPSWAAEAVALTGAYGFAGSHNLLAQVSQFVVGDVESPRWSRVAVLDSPSPRPAFQLGSPVQVQREGDSRLTPDEQKSALKKLKKEIYNPKPKRFATRVSLYYREQARNNGASQVTRNVQEDEDGKRCAICLEDFEPKEEVRVTPCDHMFHEDCILPWVKSQGQCPICRSVLCDRLTQSQSLYNNNNNIDARIWPGNLLPEGIAG